MKLLSLNTLFTFYVSQNFHTLFWRLKCTFCKTWKPLPFSSQLVFIVYYLVWHMIYYKSIGDVHNLFKTLVWQELRRKSYIIVQSCGNKFTNVCAVQQSCLWTHFISKGDLLVEFSLLSNYLPKKLRNVCVLTQNCLWTNIISKGDDRFIPHWQHD